MKIQKPSYLYSISQVAIQMAFFIFFFAAAWAWVVAAYGDFVSGNIFSECRR